MKNYWVKVIIFLALNFAAIALGGMVTGEAVTEKWYTELNKAPWTPPGWVFGAAWSLIMLCFSFFMASVLDWDRKTKTLLLGVYVIQLFLNYVWNPVFFINHDTGLALKIIVTLFFAVLWLFRQGIKVKGFPVAALILPYIIWLAIAISLNAYVVMNN